MLICHSRTKSLRQGFTLIELLIVVAIIAILAAIAVPNFMEAQVRAKIARVMNDHRTMATAIESYTVDYNRPPLGIQECKLAVVGWAQPSDPWHVVEYIAQSKMTTPVAYMTSILPDPFFTENAEYGDRTTYVYHAYVHPNLNSAIYRRVRERGYKWAIMSRGPSRPGDDQLSIQAHLDNMRPSAYNDNNAWAYDATNGTKSLGAIIRTNKGIFTIPGQ